MSNLSKQQNFKKHQFLKIKQILQCMVKEGNKHTVERNFNKMLFYMAQNKKTFKNNPWILVTKGVYNLTPQLDIKTIKIKRKVFYKLKFMTTKRQSHLIYFWLINSLKKNNLNFYKNLAFELNEASLKRGEAFNKNINFYTFLEKNIFFFKKKTKKK